MPVAFDFDSIKQRIETSLSAKSEWSKFLDYSSTVLLLEPIIQEMVYENQFKEYLTFENWWEVARNKSSLLVEAPVHGYVVPRKSGASGTLRVSTSKTFDAPYTANVSIPKYFQFSNGSTYVVSTQDYTLSTINNYVDIYCKQGIYKGISFLAQGLVYETYVIDDGNIDDTFFDLTVNGVPWTKVDSLFDYNSTDNVYEIVTDKSLTFVTLKFGNDIFGKKLKLNDVVLFRCISTLGVAGNIYSINNINKVEDQAYDNMANPIKMYVKNTTAITGGRDEPTLQDIRDLSPRIYQTGTRASSREDYSTIISTFSYISKNAVWGAVETNRDQNLDPWTFIASEENLVHLAALNASYENLTSLEKNQLIEDIYKSSDPTDIVTFETVEKIDLIFTVSATLINSSYNLNDVKNNILSTLQANYNIENVEFNQNIYYSDFMRLIDEVSGVRNHISSIASQKLLSFSEAYISEFTLPITPIYGTSIKVYIKQTTQPDSSYILLATSDSVGILIGQPGYNITGSSINIASGVGTIIVNSGLTLPYANYTIKVVYACSNQDLILKKRYHIFEYFDSVITVAYPTN